MKSGVKHMTVFKLSRETFRQNGAHNSDSTNTKEYSSLEPSRTTVSMLVLVVAASVATVPWNGNLLLHAMSSDCMLGLLEKAPAIIPVKGEILRKDNVVMFENHNRMLANMHSAGVCARNVNA